MPDISNTTENQSLTHKEIVIVDDIPTDLNYLGRLLEQFGYTPLLAGSAKKALDMISDDTDLVIADGIMPGMDGFEMVRAIKKRRDTEHIPVIMVTSLSGKKDRIEAVQSGVNDFVTKPVDHVELKVRINSMLKMKEAQDEVREYQADLERLVEQKTIDLTTALQKLQAVLNGMSDCVITLNSDNEIIDVNQAFETIAGVSNKEIQNGRFDSLLIQNRQADELMSLLSTDSRFNTKDITFPQWANKTFSVAVTHMKHGGHILVMRDITMQKQADEQKARFLALLSHELRTPLNGINGLSEVMLDDSDSFGDEHKDFLTMINTCGQQMEKIVEELLNFVQFYDHLDRPVEKDIFIEPVLRGLVQQFSDFCLEKKISISMTCSHELLQVHCLEEHLYEIMKQIIENAIKFGQENGDIWLHAYAEDATAVIQCNDNGQGISAECLPKVFDSFYQAEDYSTRSTVGLGLGLTIARRIVELYNGRVDIASDPGKGTRVTIRLPISAETPS